VSLPAARFGTRKHPRAEVEQPQKLHGTIMSFDVTVAPKFDTCFAVNCRMCNSQNFVRVDESDFIAWRNGELIQNALPYLDANERELLQTQICGTCFDYIFSDEN